MKYFLTLLLLLPGILISAQTAAFDYAKLDSFLAVYHELEPQIESEIESIEAFVSKYETLATDYSREEQIISARLMLFKTSGLAWVEMCYLYENFDSFVKNSPIPGDKNYEGEGIWTLKEMRDYRKQMHEIVWTFESRYECVLCRFYAVLMPGYEDKNPNCALCPEIQTSQTEPAEPLGMK